MSNMFGPNDPRWQGPQFRLEDVDFSRIYKLAKVGLAVVAFILVLSGIGWAQSFYTDWLWFSSLGYEQIILKILYTSVGLFFLGAAVFLALALPNIYLAHKNILSLRLINQNVPMQLYYKARTLVFWGAVSIAGLGAVVLARSFASQWEKALMFLHQVPFEESDPIFGNDLGFYVFSMPMLDFVRSWLLVAVIFVLLIVGAYYFLNSLLRGEQFSFTGRVRTHLAILGAGVLVLMALGHWLGRYDLLNSSMGAVYGIGFTEDKVLRPGLAIMTIVALAAAGVLAAAPFYRGRQLMVVALAAWFGLNIVLAHLLPGVVQRFMVEPSELARERDYLEHNINFTRQAYGLDNIVSQRHPARGEMDRQTIEDNEGTVRNVRLWDEGPLLQSYNQIQFFRLYYDFLQVHTDRYMVDDELRQVMLATRELSADKLPSEAQRWVNRRLQFTHGYGVAMTPVTEVESGGRPGFFIRDVPPTGQVELKRPEIYYGLKSLDYLIVRSRMQEFNYPGPEGPVYTHYEGEGGVKLDSFFRRLIYAWKFSDINILISNEVTRESLIQYRRTIPERFSVLTPFLQRDREAYSVVADGKVYWIQDAYTVTSRYPYSAPWQRAFNYMRNSVKTVADAYHGHMDYYISDPDDPVVQTYDAVFPDLFKPLEEMPEYLRDHIRYPLDLFTVQSQKLLEYHMQDPVVFYNKEDQWSVPVQHSFGQTEVLQPYYIVARLPGEEKEEFLLIQPFTPVNRHNLVGWLAARSDGENLGEMVLYNFPSGRHVDGPNQVEARIDNDAVISEQFTLWGQVGSEVSRGILLVIPVGDALLYAEPVFLKPDTLDFPELRRIILADSEQVVMHQMLDDSIDALVGELPAVAPVVETDEELPVREDREDRVLPEFREGLREAVDSLQEVLDGLREMLR